VVGRWKLLSGKEKKSMIDKAMNQYWCEHSAQILIVFKHIGQLLEMKEMTFIHNWLWLLESRWLSTISSSI